MNELHLGATKTIFDLPQTPQEAIVITTNGIVKKDGRAVMGRGIAKAANQIYHLDIKLAEYLRTYGNRPFCMGQYTLKGRCHTVMTYPTKHDWKEDSSLPLIVQSAKELKSLCDAWGITTCYMPRPGCSNGHLNWETTVKPAIAPILDDRFIIVTSDRYD